ncbi:MAG: hypothetical protein U0931_27210 [Vulcanimicrobiota bacterium]
MDLEQFLAELNDGGERSQFSVDWARAQAKMGAHLGLEAQDYACHFAQLAYLLGSAEIHLTSSGDWVEWSCDGRPLDEAKLRATAAGELLMAELDLCLNFCLQCVVLSDYAEKVFCSGGWQLVHQGAAGWKLRQTNTPGTRLQLKIAWKSRVKNFLRSPRKLVELELLAPRLAGSPLKLNTPQAQEKERASCIVRVQGKAQLSSSPPMAATEVVRFDYPDLEGSFWLYFQGHDCHVYSRGLGYATTPFMPGRMWLALGNPGTDLGHRQLVLNADFHQARSRMLSQLSAHFRDWLEDKTLRRFGVTEWLLNCLLAVSDLEKGEFREALTELPLFPTQFHGLVSVLDIDNEAPLRGCRVISEPCHEEFDEKPFLLVSERPLLVDYLRRRYKTVRSGEQVLDQLRQRKERQQLWKQARPLDLDQLRDYPFNWPLEAAGWQGRVGFDPTAASASLDCYRSGRLLLKMSPAFLIGGFHVLAAHPDLEPDEEWLEPRPGPHWDELVAYLKQNQTRWLGQIAPQLPLGLRANLIWQALEDDSLDPAPLMQVPVEKNPALTPERWLSDGRRADLRAWIEAQTYTPPRMRQFLVKHLGLARADQALEASTLYATHLRILKLQPQESLKLPGDPLVGLETPFPMLLGLGLNQDLQFRFYREGRLYSKSTLEEWPGLPPGLLVAAQSDDFLMTLATFEFDFDCPGFQALVREIRQALPELCLAALESGEARLRPAALAILERLQPADWPAQAILFSRLNGDPISLAEVRQTTAARVLVGAAARVSLPGFEECWCLSSRERAWLEKVLELSLEDVTREYNEFYRETRYKTGETQEVEELPDWLHPQSFKQGNLRARAGLVTGQAPAHLCEATFCRAGRAAMRCPLVLSAARPLEAPSKLVCRIDWDDLPFVENYSQLRALPEVAALIEWLRLYAFEPPLVCPSYQVARLEGELNEEWAASLDPFVVRLARAPVWGGASLRDLSQREEILWGEEAEAPLQLDSATQAGLQRLLPRCEWRHWKAPAPDQAILDALLAQPARRPALTQESFISTGSGPGYVWGVTWNLAGPSQVRLLYQGRPAGRLQPDWDVEVEAELDMHELHFTATGELRLTVPLKQRLAALWSEVRTTLLREKLRNHRLRLALFFLSRGVVPGWAGPFLEPDQLAEWWAGYTSPRPFVLDGTSLEGVPQLPPAVAGWAEQQGMSLQNCTDYARKLAVAPQNQRPVYDFHTEGLGFYLSTSREARLAIVRNVSQGRVLEQKEHQHFPPYYLERQYDRWKAPAALPPRLFNRLWKWWSQQLQADPRTLGWLADLEMEKAAPGAEELLEMARQALAAWQDLQQDEWSLLRRALQLVSPKPLRLVLCDQGPLLQSTGVSLRLNQKLAGPPGRHTILRLLNRVCLDLPDARPIPWVLHQLK